MYYRITNVLIENNDFTRSTVNAISDNTNVLRIEYFAKYGKYTTQRTDDIVSLCYQVDTICELLDYELEEVAIVKVFVVKDNNKEIEF